VPAPLLPLADVGDVHLDRGHPRKLEGIADRPRVVGPGAGVEDRSVGELGKPVQVLDVLTLVVGLEEGRLQAQLAPPALDLVLELGQGEVPVEEGIAAPEHVEIDAVQHLDPVV
jgi:hypothetical protein